MWPSFCQMTPVPPPRPSMPTWTMLGCTILNIPTSAAENTSGRGNEDCVSRLSLRSPAVVCVIAYLPVLFALSNCNLQRLQRVPANNIYRNSLAHSIPCEQHLQIFRVSNRVPIKSDQNITDHQATMLSRTILINFDNEQAM